MKFGDGVHSEEYYAHFEHMEDSVTTSTQPATPAQETSYRDMVARTQPMYDKIKERIDEADWHTYVPEIDEILRLKAEKNAVILAHNYMTPEIFHTIADITGDSLALAREAANVEADVIVMCGVHFMAETAKLMNPEKTVIIPDLDAGCSLAESITGADVRALKEKHPGVPVITYVNTSADVKAETDVCCTSGNVEKIVTSLGLDEVILIPDKYLAKNVENATGVKCITWEGRCEVHELFTPADIEQVRKDFDNVTVIAHPECPPDVVEVSDFAGSTAGMAKYVADHKPERVALITECSMADNIATYNPEVEFVRPCNMCPHMKRITLFKIKHALETMTHEITIPEDITERARGAVERMVAIG